MTWCVLTASSELSRPSTRSPLPLRTFKAKKPLFTSSFLFIQVRPDSAVLWKLVGNLHRPAFPLLPTDATCTYIGIIGNDSMQVHLRDTTCTSRLPQCPPGNPARPDEEPEAPDGKHNGERTRTCCYDSY